MTVTAGQQLDALVPTVEGYTLNVQSAAWTTSGHEVAWVMFHVACDGEWLGYAVWDSPAIAGASPPWSGRTAGRGQYFATPEEAIACLR